MDAKLGCSDPLRHTDTSTAFSVSTADYRCQSETCRNVPSMGHSPAAAPWFSCVNAMNPADCCAANASSLGLRARASRRLNAPYANSQAGGGTLSRCTSWPTWFSLSLLFWKRVRALQPHWKVCQADTGFAQLQSGKIPGLVCGRLLHWAAADGVHPTLQLICQPQTQSTPRL